MNEARITINGTPLTEAQSITLRVAVTQWHAELQDPAERALLGAINPGYLARLNELLRLMIPEPRVEHWVVCAKRGEAEYFLAPEGVDKAIADGLHVFRRSAPASHVPEALRCQPA